MAKELAMLENNEQERRIRKDFIAVDIARLITDNDAGYAAGKSSIEPYVTEIRKIVEDFGFILTMVREHNGGYHAKINGNADNEV
jgi:hypothetical protein